MTATFHNIRRSGNLMIARWLCALVLSVLLLGVLAITNAAHGEVPEPESKSKPAPGLTPTLLQAVGRVTHPPLNEISGVIKSQMFDDVWWVHNDSGDLPRLFALNSKGDVIMPNWQAKEFFVNKPVASDGEIDGKKVYPGIEIKLATHMDWEDIAIKDGLLYVGDFGNNFNSRHDLGIYVIAEPNPRQYPWTRPVKYIPIAFPDQQAIPAKSFQFDCESMFFIDGVLHLLTKHRSGQSQSPVPGTKLYRLDHERVDRVNKLTLIDTHETIGQPGPTGASVSPDGNRLAVLTTNEVWLFNRPEQGDQWLSKGDASRVKLHPKQAKQAEAICWDDPQTLRIINEQRDVFTLSVDAFEPVQPLTPPAPPPATSPLAPPAAP